VGEDLRDGHGVDFAAGVEAFLDELPEEAAGDLGGELVGDDLAGTLLVLGPGVEGQGDPEGAAVDVEAEIDGVGVAGGDGDYRALPAAVQVLAAPAVGDVEVLVHVDRLTLRDGKGKGGTRLDAALRALID